MKLIKLMYIVDREALLRWGRPISTDRYVSMDHGPVLSKTLDLINAGKDPKEKGVWFKHISEPRGYVVTLVKDSPLDELSRAEEKLIREVDQKFGHKDKWELVRFLHTLPEWKDPNGSAIQIDYRDILEAGDKTEREVVAIEDELKALGRFRSLVPAK